MSSLMCGVNRIADEIRRNTKDSLSAEHNRKSVAPRQAQSSTGDTPPAKTTRTDAAGVEAAATTAVSSAIGGISQQTGNSIVAEIAQSLEAKLSEMTDDAKK